MPPKMTSKKTEDLIERLNLKKSIDFMRITRSIENIIITFSIGNFILKKKGPIRL